MVQSFNIKPLEREKTDGTTKTNLKRTHDQTGLDEDDDDDRDDNDDAPSKEKIPKLENTTKDKDHDDSDSNSSFQLNGNDCNHPSQSSGMANNDIVMAESLDHVTKRNCNIRPQIDSNVEMTTTSQQGSQQNW